MTINKIEKYLEKKVLFPLAEAFSQCIAYYQFLTFQVTFNYPKVLERSTLRVVWVSILCNHRIVIARGSPSGRFLTTDIPEICTAPFGGKNE